MSHHGTSTWKRDDRSSRSCRELTRHDEMLLYVGSVHGAHSCRADTLGRRNDIDRDLQQIGPTESLQSVSSPEQSRAASSRHAADGSQSGFTRPCGPLSSADFTLPPPGDWVQARGNPWKSNISNMLTPMKQNETSQPTAVVKKESCQDRCSMVAEGDHRSSG